MLRRNPAHYFILCSGPGCSSSMGLLMELGSSSTLKDYYSELNKQFIGPCSIDMSENPSNGTIWNPYSWNEEANIFFLDQPSVVQRFYARAAGSLSFKCWSRVLVRRPRRNHRNDRRRRQEYTCLHLHLLRDVLPIFRSCSASLRRILWGMPENSQLER